ncbi:heterokaryon incompatibility protein-domain-containing protein [Rhexocercosporidium sp. MPI-PUGE-AT-0058]|nr:heterokaryon incompatibility protein-domain-containing protein [Rhexocercosporidium sp. MPI-PUGE-AT-0058]
MATQKRYRYTPLPDSETHIRILAIDLEQSHLHCSLEIHPILDAPPFEALSYAWGDQGPTSSILCEGANLAVTPYLLGGIQQIFALKRPQRSPKYLWLRRKRRPSSENTLRLWIDAICINQADADEKACQIPLMTKIYQDAQRVLVWLGPAADGSAKLLDTLDSLTNPLRNAKGVIELSDKTFVSAGLPPLSATIWSSAAEFLSRPWFRRLWIIQEVVLARKVLFTCGDRCIGFETLHEFLEGLTRSRIWPSLFQRARQASQAERGRRSILNLGNMRMRLEFGDASLNLLLVETRNLIFLRSAGSEERPHMLPSWVPNWNSATTTTDAGSHFSAGNCKDGSLQTFSNVLLNSTSIQLRGLELGTITATIPLYACFWERRRDDAAFCAGAGWGYQGDCLGDFNWYMRYLKHWINDNDEEAHQDRAMEYRNRFVTNLNSTWQHRCFFVTDNGHLGLASLSCRPGHKICIIFDTTNPFVLRPVENKDSFTLVCAAYVDGIMYGEAVNERNSANDRMVIIE